MQQHVDRLKDERIRWRQKHPFAFWAKPKMTSDGAVDLTEWEAAIPGPVNTPWEGGLYSMRILFPEDYPSKAPRLFFTPPLFHPNIYPSGEVCSSMLTSDWQSSFTLTDLLLMTQQLLGNPNPCHPAQAEPFQLFTIDREAYDARIRELAKQQSCKGRNQPVDENATPTPEQRYLGMDVVIDRKARQAAADARPKKPTIVIDLDENATGENIAVS